MSKTVGWNPYLYSTPVAIQCTSCTMWRVKSKYLNENSCSSRCGQCKWAACTTKRIKEIFQCLNLNLLSFKWIKLVSRLKPFLPFLSFIRHLCLMSHTMFMGAISFRITKWVCCCAAAAAAVNHHQCLVKRSIIAYRHKE